MASVVDILIKAKDQASAEIKKVTGSLNEMNKDGGESTRGLGGSFDDMLGTITTVTAIATAAITGLKMAIDFSKEGAEIVRLQDTSAMLARSMGFDMDEIVAAVSEASLNTVSDLDIISSASKAMMLGVGSSAEELASLMEVAAIRGRALGLDATEAFDQIVRGIGRLSPKILDNLGIIIDADVTYAAYAETIGKTASSLTEMEKRQALVNAVIADTAPLLAETGGLTEDSAAKWEQLEAVQANFFNKLKADAADMMVWWPEFWIKFYEAMTPPEEPNADLIDAMTGLNEAYLAGIIDLTTYNAVLGDVNNGLMSAGEAAAFVTEKTNAVRDANAEASQSWYTQLEAIWAASDSYEGFLSAVSAAGIELTLMDEASWRAGKAELALAAAASLTADELVKLEAIDFTDKQFTVKANIDTTEVDQWDAPAKYGRVIYTPQGGEGLYAAGGAVQAAASGLAATLPHYWVGELGPEPFFPATDGRIVSNTQALAALRGGAGADAKQIAMAVRQGLVDALRNSREGIGNTYNYELTMPTSQSPTDVAMAFDLLRAYGGNA